MDSKTKSYEVTIPKQEGYEPLGKVGDTGTLNYEVVSEDEKECRIRILEIEHDGQTEEVEEENSGDAFRSFAMKRGDY